MKDYLDQMLAIRPGYSEHEKLEMTAAFILGANSALREMQEGSSAEDIDNELVELFAENAQKINEAAA